MVERSNLYNFFICIFILHFHFTFFPFLFLHSILFLSVSRSLLGIVVYRDTSIIGYKTCNLNYSTQDQVIKSVKYLII
jgi:hypothetical protein